MCRINKDLLSKYELLLNNSQEIILFYDSKGCIIDCSARAKTELGYEEDIYQIKISDIFKNVFKNESNQIKLDLEAPKEVNAYRKNQTCFPVELRVSYITKNKCFIGICCAMNLSKDKEANRQINILKGNIDDNKQISIEFLAKVAHELKTPLNGMMGIASNLLDMNLEPAQLEAVNLIKRCSSGLNSLVNDLMDFARISENKLLIEHKEFSICDFIRHIVDLNISNINDKGLKLQIYVSNDIPDRLIGDEIKLSQVLNNLFSNAVKFTSAGQISLEVIKVLQTENSIELLFIIIDSGIGIDIKERDKLFKSFSQVDSSISRKYGGTGLGLTICKYIVEAMGGIIKVESEIDKGSTFSFTVPMGIPQKSDLKCNNSGDEKYQKNFNIINSTRSMPYRENDISELDYIKNKLKDISLHDSGNGINNIHDEVVDINELLEKLTICIEMENWAKSDQLACELKNFNQKLQYFNSKDILRLLFAVRREDHEASMSVVNEMKALVGKGRSTV